MIFRKIGWGVFGILGLLLAGLGMEGCATDSSSSSENSSAAKVFANRVVAYGPELPAGETLGSGFYDSSLALGETGGSLDVTSLGDDGPGEGGSITLGLGDPDDTADRSCIVDGTGNDFAVVENPFSFTDSSGTVNFTEAAYVEVSEDNVTYYRFAATFPDPNDVLLADLVGVPANYANMAGITTLADGGDGFDLADVIATWTLDSTFRACFVRIVDGGAAVPDYVSDGEFGDSSPSGADIDAVQAINFEPAPGLSP